MVAIELKKLKKGSTFILKPIARPLPKQIHVRWYYNRQKRSYACFRLGSRFKTIFMPGNRIVYLGFKF